MIANEEQAHTADEASDSKHDARRADVHNAQQGADSKDAGEADPHPAVGTVIGRYIRYFAFPHRYTRIEPHGFFLSPGIDADAGEKRGAGQGDGQPDHKLYRTPPIAFSLSSYHKRM